MILFGATDKGLVRSENQDSFSIGESGGYSFAILCDGMGGGDFGALAAEIATQEIEKYLRAKLLRRTPSRRLQKLLLSAVGRANERILKFAKKQGGDTVMGTTAVVAIMTDSGAHIVHAGDSRLYHLPKGEINQITVDHSLVQEMLDSGKITREQGYAHPHKNVITSVLGVEPKPRVDFNRISMEAGDFLLICSDGLTNMIEDREIRKTIKANSNPQRLAASFIKKALLNGGRDNITVIVAKAE